MCALACSCVSTACRAQVGHRVVALENFDHPGEFSLLGRAHNTHRPTTTWDAHVASPCIDTS
jgi:hypothetical protein